MRPIEIRADIAFMQALRCVEYRIPRTAGVPRPATLAALALRYGLMGAATAHHLIMSHDDDEEFEIVDLLSNYPSMVESHFRWEVSQKLSDGPGLILPVSFGSLAAEPISVYLSLHRQLCPLERCLRAAAGEFSRNHAEFIREGWGLFGGRKAQKWFSEVAEDSVRYSWHFFERRQADLEEVPEIALLGE